jgi:hypothetical protein
MTPREVKQLLKLLDKFRDNATPESNLNPRERGAVNTVRQWIVWFGRDEIGMEDVK